MNFAVVGLNHDTATIDIREKVAFTDSKKIEGINKILDLGIDEVVILSTCNRSEIYISIYDGKINQKIEELKCFYSEFFNIDDIENYLYFKKNEEAVMHLFKVTSGLDSIVLGEDQILGQVKDSHEFSMEIGGSSKVFNKLFREAVSTSKKIKNTLKISEHPLSISYIGVKFLRNKVESFKNKNALIIGLGKMGKLTLKYLLEEEVDNIYMINRNHKKVVDLSKEYSKVKPVDYYDRYKILNDVDILITATTSPHVIIKKDEIKDINKSLTILDLAIPKDVENCVTDIENITLYDIDDLKDISLENENKRKGLSSKAEKIIKEDINEFYNWLKNTKIDPIIKHFNNKCESIHNDTLEYILRKIDLDSRDEKIISTMINSALKRIIRNPILKLKEIEDEEKREKYIEVLKELFEIEVR